MTREELTAIVAGIIQGVAVQGALTRGGRTDLKALAVECVDQAEIVIEEARKTPEQRAEERTAREVARKMTAEAEREKLAPAFRQLWDAQIDAAEAARSAFPPAKTNPPIPAPLPLKPGIFLRDFLKADIFKK